MKTILKLAVIVAILVAIFGTATVKGWFHMGTDKFIDGVEYGANKIKNSNAIEDFTNNALDGIGSKITGVFH